VVDHLLPCACGYGLYRALPAEAISAVASRPGENLPLMAEGVGRVVSAEQVPATGSIGFFKRRRGTRVTRHVQATIVVTEKEQAVQDCDLVACQ
jgi:hypothetical protein